MVNDIDEQKYLEHVLNVIRMRLGSYGTDIARLREQIRQERMRTWDDYMHASPDLSNMQGLVQIMDTEARDVQRYERFEAQNESLLMLESSPYFARIDFTEDGQTTSAYIGRRSLMDEHNSDILVCDWRSDVAAMFYDSELGKTFYNSPAGKIDCVLELRRQYKISEGKLLYMFNTDVAVDDPVLSDELGKTTDIKLKTIISTIQKEQNVAVRDASSDLLVVQGGAGSGKTSIAMHRLAYLLYKYRDKLRSNDIVIFSPNNIFNAYIADILPDLGEDKVLQTSFYEYLSKCFPDMRATDGAVQCEAVLCGETDMSDILYKGSDEFRALLDKSCAEAADNTQNIKDVTFFGHIVRSADDVSYLYHKEYSSYAPQVRVDKIRSGVRAMLEEDPEYKSSRMDEYRRRLTEDGVISLDDYELEDGIKELWSDDVADACAQVDAMFGFDAVGIYLNALKSVSGALYERTAAELNEGKLPYEDLIALSYIKMRLGQLPVQTRIKHVLIDEAQDYPPLVYALVSELFKNARFTVVGDPSQSFIKHYDSLRQLQEYFNVRKKSFVELTKTYRSTVQINKYISDRFALQSSTMSYERSGEPVREISSGDIINCLRELCSQRASVAVICKTMRECLQLQAKLRDGGLDLDILHPDGMLKPSSAVIVPSYLAKGLEFDVIVIADGSDGEWGSASERRSLYVSMSRALHRLIVCLP